jgi:predicted dehydrogenase
MIDVGRGRPTRRAEGDPFVREDRAFIDAVQGKENRIRAPYAEALKTHRITTAAAQSVQWGRPIALQEETIYA